MTSRYGGIYDERKEDTEGKSSKNFVEKRKKEKGGGGGRVAKRIAASGTETDDGRRE
jgi:hypothetical protein